MSNFFICVVFFVRLDDKCVVRKGGLFGNSVPNGFAVFYLARVYNNHISAL